MRHLTILWISAPTLKISEVQATIRVKRFSEYEKLTLFWFSNPHSRIPKNSFYKKSWRACHAMSLPTESRKLSTLLKKKTSGTDNKQNCHQLRSSNFTCFADNYNVSIVQLNLTRAESCNICKRSHSLVQSINPVWPNATQTKTFLIYPLTQVCLSFWWGGGPQLHHSDEVNWY